MVITIFLGSLLRSNSLSSSVIRVNAHANRVAIERSHIVRNQQSARRVGEAATRGENLARDIPIFGRVTDSLDCAVAHDKGF